MAVSTVLENNIELLNFLSELKDKNNTDIKVIDDLDVSFENRSQLNLEKTKELLKSIIESKKVDPFWPKNGDVIDRCEIIGLCGKGFTSNVYRAVHEFLGIDVAIKILSDQLKIDNPEIENMFLQEAKNTAKLKHPNLVSIFDANKGDKYTYMIMEIVDGYTLETILKKHEKLNYKKAISIMIKLADVLEYALQKGMIHRDIKPGNIMLSYKDEVKLLDLGLSKILNNKNDEDNGVIVGTPIYMSPEQFISSNTVDHRSDMYSLGATFFHLITGEPPFKSKTFKEIITQKIVSDDFVPKLDNSEYPNELRVIMDKLLARDRDQRYDSYEQLKNDLNNLESNIS